MWGTDPWGASPWGTSGAIAPFDLTLSDTVDAADVFTNELLAGLRESLGITDTASQSAHLFNYLTDSARMQDATLLAWLLIASDTAAATDTFVMTPRLAALAVDTLLAVGIVDTQLAAQEALRDALAMQDVFNRGFNVSAVDTAEFADVYAAALNAAVELIDAAAVADTATYGISMTLVATDTAAAADTPLTALRAIESLTEGMVLFVSGRLASGEFSGWALNMESHAPSEYRNFEFNSFTEFPVDSGIWYATSPTLGLVKLGGNTDAGEEIAAFIRSGLSDLKSGTLKRILAMYIGFVSDEPMVLKVISTNDRGKKVEDFYKMEARTGEATRVTRAKPGKGIVSTYFGFELHNLKGADFSLDTVKWFPMNLSRRVR